MYLLHCAGVITSQKRLEAEIRDFLAKETSQLIKFLWLVDFSGIEFLVKAIIHFFDFQLSVVTEIHQHQSSEVIFEFFLAVVVLFNLHILQKFLKEIKIFQIYPFFSFFEAKNYKIAHHHKQSASGLLALIKPSERNLVYDEDKIGVKLRVLIAIAV